MFKEIVKNRWNCATTNRGKIQIKVRLDYSQTSKKNLLVYFFSSTTFTIQCACSLSIAQSSMQHLFYSNVVLKIYEIMSTAQLH